MATKSVEIDPNVKASLGEYIEKMVELFSEIRRVLRSDGTCWLNLGDSYMRNPAKGGSGPNGKHDFLPDYGSARRIMSETHGSFDGFVGRADRANRRNGDPHLKEKDLMGVPWRVAFALQDAGWYLRRDIIWAKKNPMPESAKDRPSTAHEYIFLLTKSAKYWYDSEAIKEPCAPNTLARLGRALRGYAPPGQQKHSGMLAPRANPRVSGLAEGSGSHQAVDHAKAVCGPGSKFRVSRVPGNGDPQPREGEAFKGATETRQSRSVWSFATRGFPGAHFAVFPTQIPERCILAGCPIGGLVLDPFSGSGTTMEVAKRLGRNGIAFDLSPEYCQMSRDRISAVKLKYVSQASQILPRCA